jgi:hypothetical protein
MTIEPLLKINSEVGNPPWVYGGSILTMRMDASSCVSSCGKTVRLTIGSKRRAPYGTC